MRPLTSDTRKWNLTRIVIFIGVELVGSGVIEVAVKGERYSVIDQQDKRMDFMRIINVAGNRHKKINFSSQVSFLEFDVLLIDLLDVINEYRVKDKLNEYSTDRTTVDDLTLFLRDIHRRRIEIDEFLSLGRTIFVHTPPPIKFLTFNSGGKAVSYDLREQLLPKYPRTAIGKGDSIELVSNSFIKPLFTKYEGDWRYVSSYKEEFGIPLLKIKGTNSFLSGCIKVGKGKIVFIPKYQRMAYDNVEFLDDLINIVGNIDERNDQSPKIAMPKWSLSTELPGENEIQQEITEKNKKLEELKCEIQALESQSESLKALKILFTGTGTYLEDIVSIVFKELGFNVSEGVPGRDDLILEYKDHAAVVEVKGVTKSAAERHAAQLEKWVSEYIISKDQRPKGFLVVNAYKDIPLEERNEKAFPDQMMNFSTSRDHCLLTGLDLLAIYFYIQNHPEKKEHVIDELLNTCGHFNKYHWQEYISLNNTPVQLK